MHTKDSRATGTINALGSPMGKGFGLPLRKMPFDGRLQIIFKILPLSALYHIRKFKTIKSIDI